MTIRLARPEDRELLRGLNVFPEGTFPETGVSVIAEEHGEILGFLFGQLIVHTEPVWVKKELRGNSLPALMFQELSKNLKKVGVKTVYAFSPTPLTNKILTDLAFVEKPWKSFEKVL